ncbi:MAG TPA: tetratricopeptide repeat protein [Candidatus Aquilonibacter sp.]|jgi:tetratricopeptide (TPR) repeat protein|nr:tetratricopeptide repeat protein [Candidatus Aquilonibacter sp.]
MLRPRWERLLLFAVLLLPQLSAVVLAQVQTGNVHVYVTYLDDRAVTEQLKVVLVSGSTGNQISETFTNDHGQAEFFGVAVGNYRVSVSGPDIQTTESEEFEVDARKGSQSVFVRVRSNSEDGQSAEGKANDQNNQMITAADLGVPQSAAKEFDKANEFIAKQQWQKAIDHLNRAVELYPGYAQAYTNLGVMYARLGQPEKEREALQKAINANSHFAPAFLNLARLEMRVHNFPAAETDLKQAVSFGVADAASMVLLAQAQLLNLHYEDAIADAHKVHAMFSGSHALAHYIAARACERLKRFPEAVTELKLFLAEEPSGAFAASAKQELAAIRELPSS